MGGGSRREVREFITYSSLHGQELDFMRPPIIPSIFWLRRILGAFFVKFTDRIWQIRFGDLILSHFYIMDSVGALFDLDTTA